MSTVAELSAKVSAISDVSLSAKIKRTGSKRLKYAEYKGTPMLSFTLSDDERFPFNFGPGKALHLLAVIDEIGAEKMIQMLRELGAMKDAS